MLAELKSFIVACRLFAGRGGDPSQRGSKRQRGTGLIEYLVLISVIAVVGVTAVKPLGIWGVKYPFCYYLNAEKVTSMQGLIADGYFDEDTGSCYDVPNDPVLAAYWE
jgi:hypothetical protein